MKKMVVCFVVFTMNMVAMYPDESGSGNEQHVAPHSTPVDSPQTVRLLKG